MPVHEFARNSISTEWSSYGPALFLAPDGCHLLTVYTNETFGLWDTLRLAEGERHPLPFTNTLTAAMAPGGRLAAFGSWKGEVMLWDAGTGQGRFFARVGTNKIHRLAFSPDGRYLAIANDTKTLSDMAGSNDDKRRTIRVWEVESQKETQVFSPDGEFPVSLTFSADARSLLVGCWRGPIKLWPLDRPGAGATFLGHSEGVRGLALLPDGQTLISAAQEIRFWDIRTGHETDKLNPRAGRFMGVALSADGRRLATGGSDGRIAIWDVASRQEVATFVGHQESVTYLAFTPDGDHLVSVSKDQLRVWRAASFTEAEAGFQRLSPD
jgi:WD40 repeat protein